jgi:hypothetical protein
MCDRHRRAGAWVALVSLCLSITLTTVPAVSQTSASEPAAEASFDRVRELRGQGQFDQALGALDDLMQSHGSDGDVARRIFNERVFTLLSKRSSALTVDDQDQLYTEAVAAAEKGLTRFPDLTADRQLYPPDVALIYDTLRQKMFGSVELTTKPDSSEVYMDGELVGKTPLSMRYVPVGSYELIVAHDGYRESDVGVEVTPSAVIQREVTLGKNRGTVWWLTRVVAPTLLVAGIVYYVGTNNGDGEEIPPVLPEPPDPPASSRR